MTEMTAATDAGWPAPEGMDSGRVRLPIRYVDVVPVRVDDQGTVTAVGLLLRAGSGGRRYMTAAEYDDGSAQWWGECSCPVGADCKHATAVLIVAREALDAAPEEAPPASAWELAMADLAESAPSAHGGGAPLGLQFDIEPPGRGSAAGQQSVRLRPVVPGAKGRWIRTGVSWRGLQYDYDQQRDPMRAAALRGLYRAHAAGDDGPGYYHGAGDAPVRLEDFGPPCGRPCSR
ncbi:DUF4916 domain-containing protein [Blastococcus sp. CT_GayMR19]|uniref:DUF4916 domain-containing protein n=1 Tax=Blastococcus sp. CT_GayMR19 TaxID=2559608 RepID=UPI001073F20E|nr:DUF4916 domain-containing protein [Blastococcus sp. CT_GayMR19]TFV74397.1 DUF4916 domain-containing protein [Blastococcus sp. CT_GayMR19]